jgi:hypothetical protein
LLKTLKGEVLDIRLNLGIVELATNKTFCIENTGEQVLGENLSTDEGTYVLWGFIATWFFAASPIRRSLSDKEGVVRFPWSFAMISTRSFFHTRTELKDTKYNERK